MPRGISLVQGKLRFPERFIHDRGRLGGRGRFCLQGGSQRSTRGCCARLSCIRSLKATPCFSGKAAMAVAMSQSMTKVPGNHKGALPRVLFPACVHVQDASGFPVTPTVRCGSPVRTGLEARTWGSGLRRGAWPSAGKAQRLDVGRGCSRGQGPASGRTRPGGAVRSPRTGGPCPASRNPRLGGWGLRGCAAMGMRPGRSGRG